MKRTPQSKFPARPGQGPQPAQPGRPARPLRQRAQAASPVRSGTPSQPTSQSEGQARQPSQPSNQLTQCRRIEQSVISWSDSWVGFGTLTISEIPTLRRNFQLLFGRPTVYGLARVWSVFASAMYLLACTKTTHVLATIIICACPFALVAINSELLRVSEYQVCLLLALQSLWGSNLLLLLSSDRVCRELLPTQFPFCYDYAAIAFAVQGNK